MQQKIITPIQRFLRFVRTETKYQIVLGLIVVLGTVASFSYIKTSAKAENPSSATSQAAQGGVEVARYGSSTEGYAESGNSWPGEIVSLGNLPVQPPRDGTIASWRVHIGEKVYAGQTIGNLSRAPSNPDNVAMLAEQSSMLAMAQVKNDSEQAYAEKRLKQLEELRATIVTAQTQTATIVSGDDASAAVPSVVSIKRAAVRATLRGAIADTYPMLSGNPTLPSRWTDIALRSAIGAQSSGLRNSFQSVMYRVMNDLNSSTIVPIDSGMAFFDFAIRLADASIADESFSGADISGLKTQLHQDQAMFLASVNEMKEAELMSIDKTKDYTERLREIDNEIATLTQDRTMASGELAAKEASYRTVANSVSGNTAIVAPTDGVVSTIMKKPGEFVSPGMPVAVVTSGSDSQTLLRIRIPSNIKKPAVGDELFATRPGFPGEMAKVRLIGVGNALDESGSFMADAVFETPPAWPIASSVRVIAPDKSYEKTIKLTAVQWGADGKPYVWGISKGGRIFKQSIVVGRTFDRTIEVSDGLREGDQYIVDPPSTIEEDMLIDSIKNSEPTSSSGSSYEEAMRAMGM
jgi:multidrug efflux pump subunit AcrA (membrane-fusion protein)